MKYFQFLKVKTEKNMFEKLYTWCITSKKKKSQIGNITKIWKVKVQFCGGKGGKDVCCMCPCV